MTHSQDLVAAVEKINSYLLTRSSKLDTFHQDEISLELGMSTYLVATVNLQEFTAGESASPN